MAEVLVKSRKPHRRRSNRYRRSKLRAEGAAGVAKACRGGDADAQWQMGVRYHDGEGVAHDDAQACSGSNSPRAGNVAAQGALGPIIGEVRRPRDLSRAYFWSAIAMAQGDEMSKSRIEGLSSQMTPGQVSAARQLAKVDPCS